MMMMDWFWFPMHFFFVLALLEGSLIGYDIGQHHGGKSSYQRAHRIIPLKLNICQRQAYDHTIVCQNSSRDFFHWCYKCYTSKKTLPIISSFVQKHMRIPSLPKTTYPKKKKHSFQVVVSKMFLFSPLPGEMIQFDERAYFSDGWLNNHQSSKSKCRATARPTKKVKGQMLPTWGVSWWCFYCLKSGKRVLVIFMNSLWTPSILPGPRTLPWTVSSNSLSRYCLAGANGRELRS